MYYTKHGDRTSPKVAVTFDDGPNPFFTARFLDVLKSADCTASFFLIGRFAEKHPALVKRIQLEGHTIGGHTYTHGGDDDQQTWSDFQKGNEIIEGIIDQPVKYIRLPHFDYAAVHCTELFGVLSEKICKGELIVVDHDDVISNDWKYQEVSPCDICTKVVAKCRCGSIVDLHDGSHREHEMSFRPQNTWVALPRIIQGLRERGFQMVNLDSLKLDSEAMPVEV